MIRIENEQYGYLMNIELNGTTLVITSRTCSSPILVEIPNPELINDIKIIQSERNSSMSIHVWINNVQQAEVVADDPQTHLDVIVTSSTSAQIIEVSDKLYGLNKLYDIIDK